MRKWILITFLFLCAYGKCDAQICTVPTGFICITQSAADSIAHDLDELKASRVALTKALAQVNLGDAERAAAQNLIKTMNDAFDARGRIVADQSAMIALQQKVIDMYSQLVDRLTKALNAPKSAWQKFVGILEKTVILLAGIAIGGL